MMETTNHNNTAEAQNSLADYATRYEELFASVLKKIRGNVDPSDPAKSMEKTFFNQMKSLIEKENFGFLSYLSIYNSNLNQRKGDIKFFYSKDEHDKKMFYNTEEELKRNHPSVKELLEKRITIGKLFREKEKFGDSFSYYRNNENTYWAVLKDDLYAFRENEEKNKTLTDLIGTNDNDFDEWLQQLNECYPATDAFFFCTGPVYYNKKTNEEKINKEKTNEENPTRYVISASAGICLGEEDIEKIQGFVKQFKRFVEQLSFNIVVDIKDFQTHQAAVRASIAQVMSRNMSHNIGSHVFSNLIKQEIYDNLNDTTVQNNCKNYISYNCKNYISYKDNDDVFKEGKNYQLGYFNQYLKSRMDYLSEVTFGIPTMLTTKLVKSQLIKELDQVRLLLNYIAGKDGFIYKFELKRNGEKLSQDFAVALPSGVLGCQAFYNIIENIIRNTAKHAQSKNKSENETEPQAKSKNKTKPIVFTIDFKDIDSSLGQHLTHPDEIKELICVEIDNGVEEKDNIQNIVDSQNDRINNSVLDNNNRLRHKNLGLLEMEASAAFLRQIDMSEIESDSFWVDKDNKLYNLWGNLNILKAFNKDNKLAYRFFVQRPKEFLFLGDWKICENEEEDERKKQDLLSLGIKFISEQDLLKANIPFSHQFVIYKENLSKSISSFITKHSTLFSLRRIKVEDKETEKKFVDILSNSDDDMVTMLKKEVWGQFFLSSGVFINNWEIRSSYKSDGYPNQIVFINHADKSIVEIEDETKEVWFENLKSCNWGKLPMWEEYSNGNNLICYIDNLIKDWNEHTPPPPPVYEIIEAYHNKVIAIDERLQKYAAEEEEDHIKCKTLYTTTNVLVPDEKDTPLAPDTFDEKNSSNLLNYINTNIDDAFLLIHYGILERMCKDTEDIKKQLQKWSKKAKRVIVTSGRGAHSLDLPNEVCFVNLSSVQYAFVENRNKYLINYLLNQTRKKL